MTLINLVIGVIHEKCLLTQIIQNKDKRHVKGSVPMEIIHLDISLIKDVGLFLDVQLSL